MRQKDYQKELERQNRLNQAWIECGNWNNNEFYKVKNDNDYQPDWKTVDDFLTPLAGEKA